jgi:hypothetical protein
MLSQTEITQAVRNEAAGTFTLENPITKASRTFELKHLSYDAYLEFCELAHPILSTLSGALDMGNKGGEFKLEFNPLNIDYKTVLKLAGKELPRMVLLCCKQTDPRITLEEVKELGHRPQQLVQVVLKQIKHNEMVKEIADSFPQIVEQLTALLPAAQEAIAPIPAETAPTE